MYNIKIIEKGRPVSKIIKSLSYDKIKLSESKLDKIHSKLLKELRSYIDDRRKREKEKHTDGRQLTQTNNLINTLIACSYIVKSKETYKFIIGQQDFLNQYAPYWYLINYGGKVPNAGTFIPGYFGRGNPASMYSGGRGNLGVREAFHYTGRTGKNPYKSNAHFGMVPTKPIMGMYYLNFLARRFEEEIRGLQRDTLDIVKFKGI